MTIPEKELEKQDISIIWHALSADQVLQKLQQGGGGNR